MVQLWILGLLCRLTIWLSYNIDGAQDWLSNRICERGGHNWNPKTFQVIVDGLGYDCRSCRRCNEMERKLGTAQWLPYNA